MRPSVATLLALCLISPVAFAGASPDNKGNSKETAKQSASAKTPQERVYEMSDGVQPPRLTKQVNPDYSGVRGVRVKGSVAMAVVISSQGVPTSVQVLQSLDPDVDRCAVDAVKQWRFSPARKDGKAVAVKVTVEVEFHSM